MNQEQEKIYNKLISQYNFNTLQRFAIRLGLKNNINIDWYAKPEYNHNQMKEIRFGLENNLDVTPYLNPNLIWEEMQIIRLELEK